MAAQAAIKFDVDPVWAKELTDLPMAVPEYWWLGHTSRKRCFGKIKKVDCKAPNFAYFLLEINGAPGELYGMRYDDILLYADNKNPDYIHPPGSATPPSQTREISHSENRTRTATSTEKSDCCPGRHASGETRQKATATPEGEGGDG